MDGLEGFRVADVVSDSGLTLVSRLLGLDFTPDRAREEDLSAGMTLVRVREISSAEGVDEETYHKCDARRYDTSNG